MKSHALVTATAIVALGISSVAQANLIQNGGFETGTLSSWTVDPFSLGNTQVAVYSGSYCCQGATPPEGTFAAAFGGGGNVTGEIAQAFPTIPGDFYHGSVQYAGVGAANVGSIQITLGDAISFTPIVTSGPLEPLFNGTWSTYSFSFKATSTLSGIDIVSPNGGSTDYNLDNVIVLVPEPASLFLCSAGAVGLILCVRRRRA